MTTYQDAAKTYSIVVGVDYSELSDLALERACELAKAHARTELHVIHVESDYGFASQRGSGDPTAGRCCA